MLFQTWWLLLAAGLAAGSIVWMLQHALFVALQRHRQIYTSETQHRLRDLFVFVDMRLLWPAACLLGVLLGLTALIIGAGAVVAIIVAVSCWCAPSIAISVIRRQRRRQFETQLPDALGSIAASMKAGASLATSMQSLVQHALPPLSQEFAVLNRQIRLGSSVADAMQQLASRLGGKSLETLSITVRIAIQTGGPMAAMLEQTAATLHATEQIRSRLSALTAQGWLQAWVMAAMPVGLMFVLGMLDPMFAQSLLTTSEGHAVVATVAVFEVLGMWWLRRTTSIRINV